MRSSASRVHAEDWPQQEPWVAIQRQAKHVGDHERNLRLGRFMETPLTAQRMNPPEHSSFLMSRLHWSGLTPGSDPEESQVKEPKQLPFGEARKNRLSLAINGNHKLGFR